MARRIFSDPRRDQRGFSLAELLVAMAILGLIMTGILTLLMTGNESYLAGANQVEAQAAARVALERMAEEIRGAGFNPQNVTTWNPIVASGACPDLVGSPPTATAFMIQGDGNGDGTIGATECVLYQLTGTTLQRQDFAVDASPQDVIGGVQAL
ncbi:MAG: prepilin-type N-terminal cleavage/methylation domain-containing protein, partial [Candidatus Rokubacteria bacterium]|nr:prepilin-type N-terminal cleavage/methylation domain-containing protein [Candidatus Rokubacteria bacterium]